MTIISIQPCTLDINAWGLLESPCRVILPVFFADPLFPPNSWISITGYVDGTSKMQTIAVWMTKRIISDEWCSFAHLHQIFDRLHSCIDANRYNWSLISTEPAAVSTTAVYVIRTVNLGLNRINYVCAHQYRWLWRPSCSEAFQQGENT